MSGPNEHCFAISASNYGCFFRLFTVLFVILWAFISPRIGMHYVAVIESNGAFVLYQHYPKCTESIAQIAHEIDKWQEIWRGNLGAGRLIQPLHIQSKLHLLAIGDAVSANEHNSVNILQLHYF